MQTIAGQFWELGPPSATANTDIPIQVDSQGRLLVIAAAEPIGSLSWAQTNPTLDGSSDTILAANAARKGLTVINPIGNAQVNVDITGGVVTSALGFPLLGGAWITLTGADCPVGAITGIGTNTQKVVVLEGT